MPVTPKAKYEIVADDKTAAAWRSAVSTADKAGKKIGEIAELAFAGVAVAAIGEAIKKAIEFGDEIGKAATKAGVGAKQMSELAYAARMSDIDIGSLSDALKKMQVNLSEASTGNKTVVQTLTALGLTLGQIRSLDADKQFELIADRIAKLKDPADRARAAVEIFGKAGANLLPLLTQGAEGIKNAREEAERLGIALDEHMVKKLQEGDDALKKLSATWDGWMASVAVGAVRVGQALDVIDKDKLGELQDALSAAQSRQERMGDTGNVAGMRDEQATIDSLRRQIDSLNHQESGHGAIRSSNDSAPGFQDAANHILVRDSSAFKATMAEFEQNELYIKGLEADVEKDHEETQRKRRLVSEEAEAGIRDAVRESSEANSAALDELVAQLGEAYRKTNELSVYAEEAARNMQDAFAEFLFDPFHDGIKGMLKGFIDVIRKMVAEAAAAKLFETIFGKGTGSGGGSSNSGAGNWITSGLNYLFGGGKAEGGPLEQGKWYIAGEHGPEPIWGGGPGAYAMGYGSGGGAISITNNVSITGANTVTHAELARAMKQSSDQTVATIRNDKRRGQGAFSR